jgi:hypothetical protein
VYTDLFVWATVGEYQLSEPSPDQRPGYGEPSPFTELRRVIDSAAAPSGGVRRPAQETASSSPTAPTGDLVARALAILTDEVEAWRVRRNAKDPPRSRP